jgi:hypothetical protein
VSCSLNVVAYLGRKENASTPNVLWGSWAIYHCDNIRLVIFSCFMYLHLSAVTSFVLLSLSIGGCVFLL